MSHLPVCDACFQLQDRTQFSDADIFQLKRYWDRGMTSLGSVCREKINAAANQLSVDTEIVKVGTSGTLRNTNRRCTTYCTQILVLQLAVSAVKKKKVDL